MFNFDATLLPDVSITTTKVFTIFTYNNKKAYFSGKRLQLHEFSESFGENFKQISIEEAKQKHLGKVRAIGKINDEKQLTAVLKKYFCIEEKKQEEIIVKEIKQVKENKKVDQTESEDELVLRFRATTDEREKDKIFRTILYKKGVKGKNWDTLIRNFVSYNKFRIKNISDYTEDDFYQEIVIALHKQIDKWFNENKSARFSTYAWYVIRSAFGRVLQTLDTQKRKVAYQTTNISLDNTDDNWNEIISVDKTVSKNVSFDLELENREICKNIENLFVLKKLEISEELKQDLSNIIQNKAVVKDSLNILAKKHNIPVVDLIKTEMVLRNNIKNAMYNDILLYIKYDINGDEKIAEKYNRSTGHVIKMKRQLGEVIRSKIKEII
jgi:DNA-directed RNA polymerase specialized sigma24 family protein